MLFIESHTLIRVESHHKQFTNTNHGKTARPTAGLAQARDPRSGEGSALAQAAGSRLGKIASRGLGVFARARSGEAISPERDGFSLKTQSTRLSEYLRKTPGRGPVILA